MSETIGRLLAVGNVAEVFECGSRVLKLYRSAVRKPTAFREAAIHATVEAMGLPVPAVWGVVDDESATYRYKDRAADKHSLLAHQVSLVGRPWRRRHDPIWPRVARSEHR